MDRPDGPHSGNPAVREAVKNGEMETMAWAYERPGGGRGFGFTGAHYHKNWGDENFRKVALNGILWIAHAHRMDLWESPPRIAFLSPEPGSGKSRALEVTEPLVPMPVHAVNTSPAYLFRKVAEPEGLPTLLYDEIDTVFGPKAKDNEDVRGMLNAGHRKGAKAGR